MKKGIQILAGVFAVLGAAFSILPLGTLALLPLGIALILGFLAYKQSEGKSIAAKIILGVSAVALLYVIGKVAFVKDEVEKDLKFEQQKQLQQLESQKELEELEGDLE